MKHAEPALVSAARSDPEAFAALSERTMPNVYRYILSHVGNVQDAEGLTTLSHTLLGMMELTSISEDRNANNNKSFWI